MVDEFFLGINKKWLQIRVILIVNDLGVINGNSHLVLRVLHSIIIFAKV